MRKFFVFIGLFLFLSPYGLVVAQDDVNDDSEFEKFMEELFGPGAKDMDDDEEDEEYEEPSYEKPSERGAKISPEVQKILSEKSRRVGTNLSSLSHLLSQLAKASQDVLFDPDFRERIRKDVYGKIQLPTLPVDSQIPQKADPCVPYRDQGLYGLTALIDDLLSNLAYTNALAQEKYRHQQEEIDDLVNQLTDLDHDIDELKKKEQKAKVIVKEKPGRKPKTKVLTEEKILRQLALPKEQRTLPASLLKLEREKKSIQDRITEVIKNLPTLTKELEPLKTDPEVQKALEAGAKGVTQRSSNYGGAGYDKYGRNDPSGRGGYGFPRGDRESSYTGGRGGNGFGKSYKGDDADLDDAEIEKEPTKDDDTKATYVRPPKKDEKKDKKKDKLQTDLISAMEKATTLLKEVGTAINPTTPLLDASIPNTLEEKANAIAELYDYVTQIESNKNTKQAETDKKRPEWKSKEKAYHDTFVRHIESLVLLSKYGNVGTKETSNGRFAIMRESGPQKALQSVYERLSKALPATQKKTFTQKITALKTSLVSQISTGIKQTLDGLEPFEVADLSASMLDVATTKKLATIKAQLLQTLRLILTAKNAPLSIPATPQALGLDAESIDRWKVGISERGEKIISLFSPTLQKQVHAVQSLPTSKTTYQDIEAKALKILEDKKMNRTFEDFVHPRAYETPPATRAGEPAAEGEARAAIDALLTDEAKETIQYHMVATRLNLADECILILNELRKESAEALGLSAPERPEFEVLEAFEADEVTLTDGEKKEVQAITNPQLVTIKTYDAQIMVMSRPLSPAIRALPTAQEQANRLLSGIEPSENKTLFMRLRVKENGTVKEFVRRHRHNDALEMHEAK